MLENSNLAASGWRKGQAMSYRTVILVAVLVFAIALAIVVGNRLSGEGVAVALGVAVGVVVGVPVGVLASLLTRPPAHPSGYAYIPGQDDAEGYMVALPDLEPGQVPALVVLSAEQVAQLANIGRGDGKARATPQPSLARPEQRQFITVGGADVPDLDTGINP
jgi:hypothetical protein